MKSEKSLLILVAGIILGVLICDLYYVFVDPLVLPEGSVKVINNRDYYPNVREALQNSKKSIHMVMFSMKYYTEPEFRDSNENLLFGELVKARSRGLDVRVVMDDWPEGNSYAKKKLEENNIPVTIVESNASTHAKLIIIDESIAIVGSANWVYYSIDLNNEANVMIHSQEVAGEYEEYFEGLYG